MSPSRTSPSIAVTGFGVISPLTDDRRALSEALCAGRAAIEDAAEPGAPAHAKLRDFDARRYANIRGMRVYPRNTQLQICAATLALGDAGLEASKLDPLELGTVTASSYAHLETLLEYDRGLVSVGIQRTNPTLFPLSLPSAPGALTALSLGAKAFAITLSEGDAAGLSALALGARLLAQGRAQVCVVTAAFTDFAELTLSASRAGMLTDRQGFRVFDRESRGTVLGELAVSLVLEPAARAHARGHAPLGYVRGHGAAFSPEPDGLEHALARAGRAALAAAEQDPQALSHVSASASGLRQADQAEARALHALLGEARARVGITALKSQLGESLDASCLVRAGSALLAARAGLAPPIVGLTQPAVGELRYLTQATEVDPASVLLTSISHSGACSALVVSVNP